MITDQRKIFVNDTIYPSDKAMVSIDDRGFLYGDGVFETLRTYNGKVFYLDEHLERLIRSAELIRLHIPWTKEWLSLAIHNTLSANNLEGDCVIRLTVTRGLQSGGIRPVDGQMPTIVVVTRDLNNDMYKEPWKVIISTIKRNPTGALNPASKSLNFLNNILASMEADDAGADEAIMLNMEGNVTEGSISNIFIVKKKKLITPPESDGLLAGITRNIVLEIAANKGIKVEEKSLTKDELQNAEEAFLTFSSPGIVVVNQIDEKPVNNGQTGKVTSSLMKAYSKLTKDF